MPYVWTTITSFIALMLVLWLSACQPQGGMNGGPHLSLNNMDNESYQRAEKALEGGKYKDAEKELRALSESNPADADLHSKLGNSLRLQGKNDEALAEYNAALEVLPGDPDALEGKGLVLMQQARFQEAVELFSQVLAADPNRWRSLNAVGVAFAARNHHQDAIGYYRRALAEDPNNPLVNNNIGLSFAAEKNFKDAIRSLKTAIGGFAGDEEKKKRAELNLSLVYGLADMMEPAEMLLRRYLSEDKVFYNLGLYAKLRSDYDLAHTYLNKALISSPGVYENAWKELEEVKPFLSPE